MNRRYTREEYRRLIQTLHRELPLASIGADIIVGFPGEDEQAFEQTLALVRDLPLSYLHLFPYSPRPGTLAALFRDQVPEPLKKERLRMLREIDRLKRREFAARALGRIFSALVLKPLKEKGWYEALTENYLSVRVEGKLRRNQRVRIRLTAVGPQGIRGELTA
jgi:threonylcarbamoyladenosine tRNA methylthiotransferase MtaB